MSPERLAFFDLLLAACVGFDLVQTLRTGRARGRWGTITRKHRPDRFWRYVYGDYVVLGMCAAALVWIIVSPESFAGAR